MSYNKDIVGTIIKPRRGNLKTWTELNPVLERGEFILVFLDDGEYGKILNHVGIKVGGGVRNFVNLPYVNDDMMKDWLNNGAEFAEIIEGKRPELYIHKNAYTDANNNGIIW